MGYELLVMDEKTAGCVVEYTMRLNYLRVWLRFIEYAFMDIHMRVRFGYALWSYAFVTGRSMRSGVQSKRRLVHKTTLFHYTLRIGQLLLDFPH